jgi:hypothetical protein
MKLVILGDPISGDLLGRPHPWTTWSEGLIPGHQLTSTSVGISIAGIIQKVQPN